MAIRYSVFTLHNMFKITVQVYMCGGLVVGFSTDALLVYNCSHYQLLGGGSTQILQSFDSTPIMQ